jgi:hypothetical protein
VAARIVAALVLYLANFAVQREFIFRIRDASQATLGSDPASGDEQRAAVVLAFRVSTEDGPKHSERRAA